MNLEVASIWHAHGWEEFAPVTELGSRPLTIQFLCSLTEIPDGIEFCLFGTNYRVSWKELSRLLGFSSRCSEVQTCHCKQDQRYLPRKIPEHNPHKLASKRQHNED